MQHFAVKMGGWIAARGALAMAGAFVIGGCANEGVGDPCSPERIPAGGFDNSESYVESSSVQCRSRLCIVHKLEGDPTDICGKPNATASCIEEGELDDKVYCTCRCDGPKSSVEFCDCPSGFKCEEVLALGGDGIRGSYCVKPVND